VETITTEVMQEAAKRDARGRKIIEVERWRELVTAYELSGLTQAEFARQEAVNYHTFVAWLGRCRRQGPTTRMPAAARFLEATVPVSKTAGWALEVVLPNGIVIRGTEAGAIAGLIKALEA
jgi:hypothetical protein